MARPNHPLVEDSFRPLREEADRLRETFAKANQALAEVAGGGGKGGGASGPIQQVGAAAKTASPSLDKLAESKKKVAEASRLMTGGVSQTAKALNEMQHIAKGVSDILEVMGFEEAAKQAKTFSKALGGVKDVLTGVVDLARSGALFSIAAALVGATASLVGFQAGIKAATGDTLSLKNTIAAVSLAVARFGVNAVEEIRVAWQSLADIVSQVFYSILKSVQTSFNQIVEFLSQKILAIATSLDQLPEAVKAFIPGIDQVVNGLIGMGQALKSSLAEGKAEVVAIGNAAETTSNQVTEAIIKIREESAHARAGIDETINNRFNEPDQGPLATDDPLGAAQKFMDDAKKQFGFGGGEKPPTPAEQKEEAKDTLSSPAALEGAHSAGVSAGGEWRSGVEEAMAETQQIDAAIVNALIVDPDDETKVINSFKDLLKNIKNLFKENPIGFVATVLGLSQPGGGGGGAGFAEGGIFHAGSGQRSRDPRDRHWVRVRDGEGFLSPETVGRLGERFVNMLNAGADPIIAAMSGPAPMIQPQPAGSGFARGGVMRGGASAGGPTPAFVVANDQSMQRMLVGGKTAFMTFARSEAANIRSALGL